jgi:hypothetical protein
MFFCFFLKEGGGRVEGELGRESWGGRVGEGVEGSGRRSRRERGSHFPKPKNTHPPKKKN